MIAGFLTLTEAAERSRLSLRTIRRALRDPRRPLGHLRIGRRVVIPERDLVAWLEGHRATTVAVADRALACVSPAARDLLHGLIGTPGAPEARKPAIPNGRPADSDNAHGKTGVPSGD